MEQILECILDVEGKKRRFLFEGDIVMEDEISFDALSVKEVIGNAIKPFIIKATEWSGHKLTPYDAIGDVLSKYTRNAADFHLISMYEPLKAYLDELKRDCFVVGDKTFPKTIVYGSFLEKYYLAYVTDQYTYYSDCYDSFLMLDTDDRDLITVNYFAEVGYLDSVKNVSSGKERLLYRSKEILGNPEPREQSTDEDQKGAL